jgi:RecB family exonuclease
VDDARRSTASPELVLAHHPALEPEAVAGELLAAHDEGVPWADLAVLVRWPATRGGAIVRALARHGIPATVPPAVLVEEPVVGAVADLLRWADGEDDALDRLLSSPLSRLDPVDVRRVRRAARAERRPIEERPELGPLVALRDLVLARAPVSDPAALVFAVWEEGLTHLAADDADVADERALDALVAVSRALARVPTDGDGRRGLAACRAALDAVLADAGTGDEWPSVDTAEADGRVAVLPITAAAGHQWHTVVVAGCLDGELPAAMPASPFFDPDLLAPTGPLPPAARRRRALDDERRLFAQATSCATSRTVLVAAPPPGVLVSRFADALVSRPPRLPPLAAEVAPVLAPTPGAAPVWPEGRLRLSATQLETYDDCPRRYAYEYVLHLRRPSGAAADLGTLVHRVLAEFLDPDRPGERTREELLALAQRHWRDDVAPYRPQVEELRRDYVAMLDAWWESEARPGQHAVAVERRFEVGVGPHQVAGAIDLIERLPDGGGLRIVDFKTGKSEPGPDDVAENLQLATYHLAARRDPELAALGDVAELALVFLRSGHVLEQPITDDHEAGTEARILATAEQVLAEVFPPSVDAHCDWCALQRVCPLWPEGREVASA